MATDLFTSPVFPPDLRAQIADRYATFAGWRMEAEGGGEGASGEGEGPGEGEGNGEGEGQTFTQADIDKIVGKTRTEERRKAAEKYADYDELKKKAGDKATAEERIADLEREIEASKREALRRRVQAAHGIADEDADLFLTASDEETLQKQAERLSSRLAERKKQGNRAPKEGASTKAPADEEREAARSLFASGS